VLSVTTTPTDRNGLPRLLILCHHPAFNVALRMLFRNAFVSDVLVTTSVCYNGLLGCQIMSLSLFVTVLIG